MSKADISGTVGSNGSGTGRGGIATPTSVTPVLEMHVSETSEPSPPNSGSTRDPYRGVVLVLLAGALVGMAGALDYGLKLGNPVLIDTALLLGLAAGILVGVAWAQRSRLLPPKLPVPAASAEEEPLPETAPDTEAAPESPMAADEVRVSLSVLLRYHRARLYQKLQQIGYIRGGTAAVGVIAIFLSLGLNLFPPVFTPPWAATVAGVCLLAAGLSATAVHYLVRVDPLQFPEAPELCQGARVIAWLLLTAAASIGLGWRGVSIGYWRAPEITIQVIHFALLAFAATVCFGLVALKQQGDEDRRFTLAFGVLSVFGSRNNILASVLDSAERQLGIDLRSTWALNVVRRSLEPLAISLLLAGWLSTSLTVVGTQEQGLVERFGVAMGGQPLDPGLHLHLPWPVDRVYRVPVKRIQSLTVGHEGEEEGGPENVLWAVEHAPNEFTLLLGNGRDLITIDAAVAFRITDARAWRYHSQNPADALKAIAYRAVMRNTVNRTLSDALSENVAELTSIMRDMVQRDADALGLGVHVEAFTLGGMHPPVPVAADYEAVVSAELGKTTAVVNAQVFRNQAVPAAEAFVLRMSNNASAVGAENLAKAAGQAWAFRALESQFRASPQEFYFRRRLETLEKGLGERRYTVVDSRIQRDGGELWLTQ